MPNSPDDATRFAIGARLNYECAVAADEKVGRLPGYECCAPIPVMMLFAFSIELSLKSYLLRSGQSLSLVKTFRHDLSKLVLACRELAAIDATEFDGLDLETLALVSELHGVDFSLRYYERPRSDEFPTGGSIHELAMKCLTLCDAPDLDEIIVR